MRRALRLFGTSAALARSPVTLVAASSKGKPALIRERPEVTQRARPPDRALCLLTDRFLLVRRNVAWVAALPVPQSAYGSAIWWHTTGTSNDVASLREPGAERAGFFLCGLELCEVALENFEAGLEGLQFRLCGLNNERFIKIMFDHPTMRSHLAFDLYLVIDRCCDRSVLP